jgi:hypothetical protein
MYKWMHFLPYRTGGYAQYRYDKKQSSFKQYGLTVKQFKYWGYLRRHDDIHGNILCLKYKAQTQSISYYQQMHILH